MSSKNELFFLCDMAFCTHKENIVFTGITLLYIYGWMMISRYDDDDTLLEKETREPESMNS